MYDLQSRYYDANICRFINSDQHLYDENGLKQTRHYGPDGKAEYDIDYHHGGQNHTFPHIHYWDWSQSIPRGEGVPITIFP